MDNMHEVVFVIIPGLDWGSNEGQFSSPREQYWNRELKEKGQIIRVLSHSQCDADNSYIPVFRPCYSYSLSTFMDTNYIYIHTYIHSFII